MKSDSIQDIQDSIQDIQDIQYFIQDFGIQDLFNIHSIFIQDIQDIQDSFKIFNS